MAVEEIFDGKFGEAKNVLIEEFLEGEEMSYFIVSDGTTIKNFETAQDHKRVLEGDIGKNTGGMGAYSPSRLINSDLVKFSGFTPTDAAHVLSLFNDFNVEAANLGANIFSKQKMISGEFIAENAIQVSKS